MILDLPTATDPWKMYQGDAHDLLCRLPDNSIDLLFTSPPYEDRRTYGIGFKLKGEAWVSWMVEFVRLAQPKVKGLIAIVCDGHTSKFRYSATPILLAADLHRAGYNLRKPAIYKRGGPAGSGGRDWLRNNWEPIICITRGGRLPWSNNVACGHPPKCKPGGPPSNRNRLGVRTKGRYYKPPALANPGLIIDCGSGGGGHMGHDLAHENEAPFPMKLARFFVKSFCPPGGVVLDAFAGSGTTIQAAVEEGRRAIGFDLRESQVELVRRRMADVQVKGIEA